MDTEGKFLVACSIIIYAVLVLSVEVNDPYLKVFLTSDIGFVILVPITFCIVVFIYSLISPLLKRVLKWLLTSPDDSFFVEHDDKIK